MPRNEKEEITSLRRITKKGLKELCKKNKLYQTPELNDVLYLHYQGFQDIECLEEYTGLKCLWLESNAISDIKGLDNQKQLKCLFLHNNLIRKIENLESCRELDTLNLSNNHISRIENCGVDKLPVLTTLNLAHNYLKCMEDLKNLTECKQVSVLDLGNNRIEDILIVKILAEMPELRVLVLTGNPVVSRIPQYRKTLTLECKELTYLDSRPVFPRDRACAEAWKRGGYEEERREHDRWNKAERKKIRDSVNATLRLRNRGGGDPQVDLIASSSDEDEGFTERSSAPLKEDLQNMTTEEVNAEIIELMRLGDLVEFEQNEKFPKEDVKNEQENETGDLECNPCIINQTEAIPENKLIPANKSAEDTTAEENSEALERYGKTYKQAYDNYLEYVQILTNQDHSTIISDQDKDNRDTAEFKAENKDNSENKMSINENDVHEISEQNLIFTLNDDKTSSLTKLTKEDKSDLELNKDSGEINFTDTESKDDTSIAESDSGKTEDVTDSETELNQSEKVKNESPSESADSTNLQFYEKDISSVKEEISIFPISSMDSYLSLNSQTNNLSMPSFMFPKTVEDNESQVAPVSDVESDQLEESHDDECKTGRRSIKEFISNYEQFLGTIDDRKSHEKKETSSEKSDKVDVEKSSNNIVDVDSSSNFKKIRFFVQNYPEVENEENSKLQIINRLLENPITKQMSNKESLKELDQQLQHIQEEQTKWIKKVTDKCYSQRDRYNDDLEVINNELCVIKKDGNNASDKVGRDDFNDINDEINNTQPQHLKPVHKLIKIDEDLENDDSEVYEMASFVWEENPSERTEKVLLSSDIIKCNENYSKSEFKEQDNYSQREGLANMTEYLEYEPNFSNNDLLNNSERLSDSDSIEEYFVPPTGSPQKDQLTDFNTGIPSNLENTPEEIWKCNPFELKSQKKSKLSEIETELQYDFKEISSTSKANLGKLSVSKKVRELQYDTAEILSKRVNSEEKKQCNAPSSEKETELQDDFAEIPSTSKTCLEKLRKNSFSEKQRCEQYDTAEVFSTLEVISEEEKQCNSSEKTELYDNFSEIPSTSKTCIEKQQKFNFSEEDKDRQSHVTDPFSILEANLEEDEKFYISKKENDLQYTAAEVPFTLEDISEKQHKRNLPIEEIDLQYDDPSSTFNVKEFGSISENFEWIKSSILTLASNGRTEGSGDMQANDKYVYSTDPEIDKIHRDIDEDFHKDLINLFINASLEYKMIESAEKYGDPEVDSPFDIEQRAQWYLEELKNHLSPEMKELISNENKNWHRFSGDADEFRNSNNIDESPHIKRLHEILKSRNAAPGVVDKNKVLLKLVLANKNHLLNHENPEARELAKKILKDNGIEEPDTDAASTEVNLSNTSTEVVEDKFTI